MSDFDSDSCEVLDDVEEETNSCEFAKVVFPQVAETYTRGANVNCRYIITNDEIEVAHRVGRPRAPPNAAAAQAADARPAPVGPRAIVKLVHRRVKARVMKPERKRQLKGMRAEARGWVALYRVGWGSSRDYVTFMWAPLPANYKAGVETESSVLFQAHALPSDDGEFYQFCYMASSGALRGASTPFQFKSAGSVADLVQLEDKEADVLVVTTRTNMLQEQLSEMKLEAELLRDKNAELEAERLKDKDALLEAKEKNVGLEAERLKDKDALLEAKEKNVGLEAERLREKNDLLEAERLREENALLEAQRLGEKNALLEAERLREKSALLETERLREKNALLEAERFRDKNALLEAERLRERNALLEAERLREKNALLACVQAVREGKVHIADQVEGEDRLEVERRSACGDIVIAEDGSRDVCLEPDHADVDKPGNRLQEAAPCFYIQSELNGSVLDVQGRSTAPGTRVIVYHRASKFERLFATNENQHWYEDPQGVIRSQLNDYALDVTEGTPARIVVNPYDEHNKNQQWVFEEDFIVNRGWGAVLDIVGASRRDSAEVCPYARHGHANQRWRKVLVTL